jgi:hypothetical protein
MPDNFIKTTEKAKQKFILFNVDIAGYKRGDKIPLNDNTPQGPKSWLRNKDILIEDRICFLVNEKGERIEPGQGTNPPKAGKPGRPKKNKDDLKLIKCKGFNADGSYCQRTDLETNGFCVGHQDQAKQI